MGTYLEHTRKACLTSAEDKQGFTLQAYCLWGQGPENVFYKVSSEVDARAEFGFVSKGLIAKSGPNLVAWGIWVTGEDSL